jgi:uncharacterized protein
LGRSRIGSAALRAALRPGNAILAAAFALVFFATFALAAFNFPALTGRVVDQANVIAPATRSAIEAKSKELEDKSGIQLVVATVKSLQDSDIETYANQLFRFWKLGEAKKNNGVLLLVAPTEHKVRIEVGYGLEGTLTDALSSVIIASAMVPRFKANDYSGGIERGVDGIISVLTTDAAEWHKKAELRSQRPQATFNVFPILIFLLILFIIFYLMRNANGPPGSGGSGTGGRRGGPPVFIPYGEGGWGGGSGWGGGGGGGFGGGFGGGGGSSVAAAIHAAEARTCGQIVCVLAHASSGYAHVPILWASVLALVSPWPLIAFTLWSIELIYAVQLAVFLVAALVLWLTPLRLALVPRAVKRARAHHAGLEQFVIRRIAATKNRCGVLIFVSLAERYARIIADEGIAAKVPASEWQAAIDALTAQMRTGRIADGFVAAIERCGAVLAAHAPPDGSPNELPDRLYMM